MKKSTLLASLLLCLTALQAQTLNFTVTSNSGSYSITCANPTINLTITSESTVAFSYTLTGPSSTMTNGSSTQTPVYLSATSPGIYTLAASFGTLAATQTLAIYANTTVPVSSVSPSVQSIICGNAATVTATSTNTSGYSHYFHSPLGAILISTVQTAIYNPMGPGTYTHILMDQLNGCKTQTTVTILGGSFPSFSLTSAENFTLGCNTRSVATINIINASATDPNQIPNGGPVSYTLLSPSSGGISTTGTLSAISNYTVNVGGTYTVVVRDNTSNCTTMLPITISTNTTRPGVFVSSPTRTVTCFNPTVTLMGLSSSTNVSYVWLYPGIPGASPGNAYQVTANSITPTQTLVGNFTITVTDNSSTCKSTSVVPVYQNLFPPQAVISSGNQNSLTCVTPTIVLTNQSTSGIPAVFNPTLPVVAYSWHGPSDPITLSTTYTVSAPGVYTMIAQDMNNGCKSTATINVGDNTSYPAVNNSTLFDICGNTSILIYGVITTPTAGYTYSWTAPSNATVIGANAATLTTNAAGIYTLTVMSNQGCATTKTIEVAFCVGLGESSKANSIIIYPNPTTGQLLLSTTALVDFEVTILDVTGKVVRTANMQKSSEIDLASLPAGVYQLLLSESGRVIRSEKIIKQ